MPIYAYRCDACGHAKDVLRKVSDPLLTVCPACGASSFRKQLTAAGFQLKGSGWYVTDFRGGNAAAKADDSAKPDAGGAQPAGGNAATPAQARSDAGKADATPAAASPPAGTPSGGCGGSCACH